MNDRKIIYLDDAIYALKREQRFDESPIPEIRWFDFGLMKAQEILSELPSAQPDIIRCKDCKHRPFDSEDTQGFGVEFPDEKCPCQCEDGWYNWRPNNEWFCANAERRTDVKADKGASR